MDCKDSDHSQVEHDSTEILRLDYNVVMTIRFSVQLASLSLIKSISNGNYDWITISNTTPSVHIQHEKTRTLKALSKSYVFVVHHYTLCTLSHNYSTLFGQRFDKIDNEINHLGIKSRTFHLEVAGSFNQVCINPSSSRLELVLQLLYARKAIFSPHDE